MCLAFSTRQRMLETGLLREHTPQVPIETKVDHYESHETILKNTRVTEIIQKEYRHYITSTQMPPLSQDFKLTKEGLPMPVTTSSTKSRLSSGMVSFIKSLTPISQFLLVMSVLMLLDVVRRVVLLHQMPVTPKTVSRDADSLYETFLALISKNP